MTLSLWMLLGFAAWTLLVLLAGVGVLRWSLILRERAQLIDFPGDVPHGSLGYRRAVRAHANCVENLPVFGAIVLIATAANFDSPDFGRLAAVTLAARILQTCVHALFSETNVTIGIRFALFSIQLLVMLTMIVVVATTASGVR